MVTNTIVALNTHKELLERKSFVLCQEQSNKINAYYPTQANPRPINLFYLNEIGRNRIEWKNGQFTIVNTNLSFSEAEILNELNDYPERFSTNVITRGLLQETCLPNIAFIGGGAEIAYWLQYKNMFKHYGVAFPLLVLRNFVLIIDKSQSDLLKKLNIKLADIFLSTEQLVKEYVKMIATNDLNLSKDTRLAPTSRGTTSLMEGRKCWMMHVSVSVSWTLTISGQ
jgi:uncharacterized protein YllA (UPF0747 family)